MALVGKVIEAIKEWRPDLTIVDEGGLGAGVVDRLKEQNYKVRGVAFGSKADNPTAYFNKRSEMWGTMRDWLRSASIGSLEDNGEADNKLLKQELTAPKYKSSSNGSIQLESKAEMKKRGVASPDMGDAVAISLAFPIGSGVLSSEKFKMWSGELPLFEKIIQSYRGAYTEKSMKDEVSSTVWGVFNNKGVRCVMLLDAWAEKMSYTDMRQNVIKDWHATYGNKSQVKKHKPDVVLMGIEGAGETMIADLRAANVWVATYKPGDVDLIERSHQVAPILDMDVVYVLPSERRKGEVISWAKALMDQCDRFPNDDEIGHIDTMTRALMYIRDSKWLEMQIADDDERDDDLDNRRRKVRENPYAM
jgi:phage terminase large subunit-like protein